MSGIMMALIASVTTFSISGGTTSVTGSSTRLGAGSASGTADLLLVR